MVTATQRALARIREFGTQMSAALPPIDRVLPALRALLDGLGADYRIVGGAAVVHHGYERLTVDLDVLVARDGVTGLDAHLAASGFSRESPRRLRHIETGVRVDLLCGGELLPGRGGGTKLPALAAVGRSNDDPAFIALPDLLDLKLDAGRHQDLADVVALLKTLDDGRYIVVEASVRADHRQALASLRDDALKELAWARALDPDEEAEGA